MELRRAAMADLPQLKKMYQGIVRRMEENGLFIWDDCYPCAFLEEDIKQERLYLLSQGDTFVSAFALCNENAGESAVKWKDSGAKAVYLDRLGVNAAYTGQGIGGLTLTKAQETAWSLRAVYLRLFVVDINAPAIGLYEKHGFVRAAGQFDERIDASCTLREWGYEIPLSLAYR